jgi:hypothetical protein
MKSLTLGRKTYWICVVLWVAAKLGLAIVISNLPPSLAFVVLDDGITVALAVVVGARFVDAGWNRTLGMVLMVTAVMALPVMLLNWKRPPGDLFENLPDRVWLAVPVILAFLIVAGIKKGRPPTAAGPGLEVKTVSGH